MIDGCINVYKEPGFTSFDVVAKLRGILKQKKIGHTGTLDPLAEGVLLVCLGSATKLSELLIEKEKTYRCVMQLGKTTDTEDISGRVLTETDRIPEPSAIEAVMRGFVGTYDQIPPMYSAIKVNGKKLYEYARQGIEIERTARPVTIDRLEILKMDLPYVTFDVHCSKGTYIRSLCRDIGEALSCGAVMERLVRTEVNRFRAEDALTLAEIERARDDGTLSGYILPMERLLPDYQELHIRKNALSEKLLRNGNPLAPSHFEEQRIYQGDGVRVYDAAGRFAAIYRYDEKKTAYVPVKMFPAETSHTLHETRE